MEINELDIVECLGEHIHDSKYRAAFYKEYGYNASALTDTNTAIRLAGYKALGFTTDAFNDPYSGIRSAAYDSLGYTTQALSDAYEPIQYEAALRLSPEQLAPFVGFKCSCRVSDAIRAAVVQLLPSGDDIRYVVHVVDNGYYANKQDEYHYTFTDDIELAKMFKAKHKAISRAKDLSTAWCDNDRVTVDDWYAGFAANQIVVSAVKVEKTLTKVVDIACN